MNSPRRPKRVLLRAAEAAATLTLVLVVASCGTKTAPPTIARAAAAAGAAVAVCETCGALTAAPATWGHCRVEHTQLGVDANTNLTGLVGVVRHEVFPEGR